MSELDDTENYIETLTNVLRGLNYAGKYGEEFDPEKAVYFLQRALDENMMKDSSATNHIKFLIGKISLEYLINENNVQDHMRLITESAENGCFVAQLYLGHAFFFGSDHIERNDEMGIYWWEKTSDQGDFFTRFCLANAYFNGTGVEQNYQKAVALAETVPIDEVPVVSLLLGRAYMFGMGAKKDPEKAVKYFEIGAQNGNPVSQFELANALTSGEGIDANEVDAFNWYQKSAESGYARAQGWLGLLYFSGQGTERDLEKAKYWTNLGAENGDGFAQNFLRQFPKAEIIPFPTYSNSEIEDKMLRSNIQSLSVERLNEMFTPEQRIELRDLFQNLDNFSSTHVFERSTRELIAVGENHEVEYKETYETEAGTRNKNKNLRVQVAKEIVGFLNSCDGVLLIGVSDDQRVTGIEADGFNGNEDKFALKINDFLVSCLGTVAASAVKIKFEKLEEKTVCRIEVTKSKAPVYLNVESKSGDKGGGAYIRINSSTRVPSSIREWDNWRDSNFKK